MARRDRKTNKKFPKFFSNILLGVLIFTVICTSSFLALRMLFLHNDSFRIKYIKLDMPENLKLKFSKYNDFLGEPIISVDLKQLTDYTPQRYPSLEYIKAIRQFPNCISIKAKARTPVATTSKQLLVDSYGVVFPDIFNGNYENLPFISGILSERIELGLPIKSRKLDLAFEIIDGLKTNNVLSSYRIKSVDVSNLSNVFFNLEGCPEVRIDEKDVGKRLFILAKMFSDVKKDLAQIKYVDLRFKDPVMGYK